MMVLVFERMQLRPVIISGVSSNPYSRRELLKRAGPAAVLLTQQAAPQTNNDIEIRVTPVGKSTLRLTLLPSAMPVVIHDGSMARTDWGKPAVTWSVSAGDRQINARNFAVQ